VRPENEGRIVSEDGSAKSDTSDHQAGVKAVETAARLLVAMRDGSGRDMLKDIAARADMHPAKAHRYLLSLIRAGIIKKEEASGLYAWGPLAIDIGAAAIRTTSFVRSGANEAISLRDKLEVNVALAVWGTFGPTHIYEEDANRAIITRSQIGSVLPLLNSATGRAFAAFDRTPVVVEAIQKEITAKSDSVAEQSRIRREFDALCAKTREVGLGQAIGDYHRGVISLSCPVFDYRSVMIGAMTILSHQGDFDPSVDGPAARALKDSGLKVSRELGFL
jgi:DNA-binding IclR family transcriptional regulator